MPQSSMFARIRRASGGLAGSGSAASFGAGQRQQQQQREDPSGSSSNLASEYGDGGDPKRHAEAASRSLEELREALDRLEYLTEKISPVAKGEDEDSGRGKSGWAAAAPPSRSKTTSPPNGDKAAGGAAHAGVATISEKAAAERAINETIAASGENSTNEDKEKSAEGAVQSKVILAAMPRHFKRSPSAAAADIRANSNAEFLPVSRADELEMVELLRRIAELVVLSERKASQLLSVEERARNDYSQSKGEDTGESSSQTTETRKWRGDYNEDVALPYLALFELFCERNALANIVNIVTGAAFVNESIGSQPIEESTSSTADTPKKSTRTLPLPPLTIATQAVQSVSILVQNVSRATSLYFLLSNNRVNDLIGLPLHLYKRAELNLLLARYNDKYSRRRGGRSPLPPNLLNYQSSEMGELTTHFVSFLKSLAMRVNSETLQFFLSFPLNDMGHNNAFSAGGGSTVSSGEESVGGKGGEDERAHAPGTKQNPEMATKSSNKADTPSATQNNSHAQLLSYLERRKVVEFPLYARALEFCAPEQDSFVRVTAMNVCMNIIRLATVHGDADEEDDEDIETGNGKEEGIQNGDKPKQRQPELPTKTPSGLLHEASALPLQDRIAIAQYACHPCHVSDLVSPLCARLTGQFGQVEGAVRALEELNEEMATEAAASEAMTKSPKGPANKASDKKQQLQEKNKKAGEEKRTRLRKTIQDLITNVQDELWLLDDLLRVGLISLNEQAIEMMLATFVYPMLLQPLLLPVHRFGLSKVKQNEGVEQKEGGSTAPKVLPGGASNLGEGGRKPVITMQSSRPFRKHPLDNSSQNYEVKVASNNTSEFNEEGERSTSNENPEESVSNGGQVTPTADDDKQRMYSSCDMDLAPSKTALFGLSVIFHTVSNATFRHLLLTALLHPLSPEASGGTVVSAPPQITLPKSGGGVYSSDDFQLDIRMEGSQAQASREGEPVNVYSFGMEMEGCQEGDEDGGSSSNEKDSDFANACVFILAPALVDVLRNNPWVIFKSQGGSSQTASSTTMRLNPYRNVLLSSASGLAEMVALQPLATAALHAAVSSVDGTTIRNIMLLPAALSAEEVRAMLECLCRGIVNESVTYDGWWKARFNTVAARTLMNVVSDNLEYIDLVVSLVSDMRLRAAEFLMTLPGHLDAKSRQGDEVSSLPSSPGRRKANPLEKQEHLDTWLLDRFFFDQADKGGISVVENICYLREHSARDGTTKEQYRYGLEVLSSISIAGASALSCEDVRVVDNMIVAADAKSSTPFHCAASWALAVLYLDAFCVKMSKMAAEMDVGNEREKEGKAQLLPKRKLSYISATSEEDEDDSVDGSSLAHISSKFSIAMLDEGESSEAKDGAGGASAPAHGSAVGLVGKSAFPCVCEVSSAFAPLFTGHTCISNEGIRWQSLYLVIMGRWAVLAEPGHGGSGGEGRVVMSCRLACLGARKDPSANNRTPARRLLLAHASLDPRPPSLFVADRSATAARGRGSGGPSLGPDGLRLTRSKLDLWFEDAAAALHAHKVISARIARARARRGGKIRAALLAR